MAEMRKPSASSIADAKAAIPGMTPGLAGALDAERVERRRRLEVVDLDRLGTSVAYGMRKSMKEAFCSWPSAS
jgi:hypothetical protein